MNRSAHLRDSHLQVHLGLGQLHALNQVRHLAHVLEVDPQVRPAGLCGCRPTDKGHAPTNESRQTGTTAKEKTLERQAKLTLDVTDIGGANMSVRGRGVSNDGSSFVPFFPLYQKRKTKLFVGAVLEDHGAKAVRALSVTVE